MRDDDPEDLRGAQAVGLLIIFSLVFYTALGLGLWWLFW